MYYMIINNFNTSTLSNCYVTDFGKAQAATPRATEKVSIYGANGSEIILDGAYESYERVFTFYVPKLIDISTIIEKFQPKDNVIEFGYQLGSFFYADFVDASYSPNGPHAWALEVKLEMQPFRYQKNVQDVVLTGNGTVTNTGTVYSEPVITLEGSGDVSLTIGQQTMYLTLDTKATIVCQHKRQNVYDKNGNIKNTLRKRGPFFEIPVGRSGVSVSGNIRKITIKGYWRYKV